MGILSEWSTFNILSNNDKKEEPISDCCWILSINEGYFAD